MLNLLCFRFVVGPSWHSAGHAAPAMSLPPNGSQHQGGGGSRRPKVCGACGDRAKSFHFGGISCDSCKAFFRRSVQNEAYRNFHCPYEGRCEITIASRKCCQFCRFQKCLSIGMETGWVMTEEERLQLVKNRMERKQRQGTLESFQPQQESSKKPHRTPAFSDFEPDIGDLPKHLSSDDIQNIESLVNAYECSYLEVPFSENLQKSSPRTRTEILDMFFTAVKQFTNFSQRLDSFRRIAQRDQEVLLRTGVLELCFVRGAYVYDERLARWPHTGKPLYRDSPTLEAEDIKKLVSSELFEKHMEFIRSVKDLGPDEATTMLLLVIILLSPDRPGLVDEAKVADEQERFYILLKKYMNWRYGEESTVMLYPKLLLRLPDLRELNDNHTDYNLRLGSDEMQLIQQKLSSLKIDSCFQKAEAPGVVTSAAASPAASVPGPSSGQEGRKFRKIDSCFQKSESAAASGASSAAASSAAASVPGTSSSSWEGGSGSRVPWSLARDVFRTPSSPFSLEEESSSSESSDRTAPYRS